MTWKQFLTEKVLKEQWHELFLNMPKVKCSCGKEFFALSLDALNEHRTRTYDTEADMMELYRRIEKDGKWDDFVKHTNAKWGENAALYMVVEEAIADYIAWLFCLNGKNYEDLCKVVAEFYGLEGEK
jgi:hypothetical protein